MTVEGLEAIRVKFVGDAQNDSSLAIKQHIEAHEGVTLIDVVKFLYQSTMGNLHILDHMNEPEIEAWISKNLEASQSAKEPLIENLYGARWIRLNLSAFKQRFGSDKKLLMKLFLAGKKIVGVSTAEFSANMHDLQRLVSAGKIRASDETQDLRDLTVHFLSEYEKTGYRPLHHSKSYRDRNPEYVVVPRESLSLIEGKDQFVHQNRKPSE